MKISVIYIGVELWVSSLPGMNSHILKYKEIITKCQQHKNKMEK